MLLMTFNKCFLCISFIKKVERMNTWHYWWHNGNMLLSETLFSRRKLFWNYCAKFIGCIFLLKPTNALCQNITMELLSQYTSNSSSESPDSSDKDSVRSVYLLTYSRADLRIFPGRKSFADAVCEAVLNCEGPKAKIVQWSCCQESHKKGGKKHFHMAIKLNRTY